MMNPDEPTLILAGGGLANGLIALKIAETHPGTRILLLEAGDRPGGNHTWSFHAGDLDDEGHRLMAPLVAYRWTCQRVRFPEYSRTLGKGYLTTHSAALAARLAATPGIEQRCNARVASLEPDAVVLDDGERIDGTAVIDGRGPGQSAGMILGFQKFLGQEIRTTEPHGLDTPVIMDATVSQQDGYRFVYVLPLTEDRVLVEDTYYSEAGELSRNALLGRIDAYITQQGWRRAELVREEQGVLPVLMAGDFNRFWPRRDAIARSGLRAALFHPTTGYSLPQAVELACLLARRWPVDGLTLGHITRTHARAFWRRAGLFRLLNRMLFRAGRPEQRYRVLQRFYTLDERLITNFYAARPTLYQRLRLVTGKPPVPFFEGLSMLGERKFLHRERKRQ